MPIRKRSRTRSKILTKADLTMAASTDANAAPLMTHCIEHSIKADSVSVGREMEEERRVIPFAFPRVGDVGVVRHQHYDAALLVGDCGQIGHGALPAELGGIAA